MSDNAERVLHSTLDVAAFTTVEHEHRWVTPVEPVDQVWVPVGRADEYLNYQAVGVLPDEVFCAVAGCGMKP